MDFDLIICGGGTAGSVAAIRAARLGLKVALVERQSRLGGSATLGLVAPMMSNRANGRYLVGGLNRELRDRLERDGFADGRGFDPLMAAVALEDMAHQAGVTILYHAELTGVHRRGRRIRDVVLSALGRRLVLSARCFIDATGDAILAMLAGEPTVEGREEDGAHQLMSLRFLLASVDVARALKHVEQTCPAGKRPYWPCSERSETRSLSVAPRWLQGEAVAAGYLGAWQEHLVFSFYTVPGRPDTVNFNAPHVHGFDPADPAGLSEAYVDGRTQILEYWRFFRDRFPGFERSYIAEIAPLIGIRECRRLVGEFVLSEQDVRELRHFADGICQCNYMIDLHLPDARGAHKAGWWPPTDQWYEIPYRAMIPPRTDNLLVAGRCISTDFVAQGSYRIIPICRGLGEAAAFACRMSLAGRKALREIDAPELRRRLVSEEVICEGGPGGQEAGTVR